LTVIRGTYQGLIGTGQSDQLNEDDFAHFWFDRLGKSFCCEEVQFKMFCLPVKKNSCPLAESDKCQTPKVHIKVSSVKQASLIKYYL